MTQEESKARAPQGHAYTGSKKADQHANPERGDITPEFARRCLLAAAASFLVFLAAGFAFHDRNYLSDGFFVRKYQHREKSDIVFVGDSRVIRGVDPSKVEESIPGARSYNFGFSGLGIDLDVLNHAKRLIDPISRYKVIAVAVSRPSLSAENAENNGYLEVEEMTSVERANLAALGKYEGLFKMRPPRIIPIRPDDSGFVFTGTVKASEAVARRDENNADDRRTWVSDAQVAKLAEWIASSTAQGYRIVVFRVPTSQRMYEIETGKLGLNLPSLRTKLESAGAAWIETPPYRRDLASYDGSHLTGKAAQAFTLELARKLRETIGAQP
ncbi:MAG TPA: hypothetical protein VGE01_09015 [Fimbriimonas sp.]